MQSLLGFRYSLKASDLYEAMVRQGNNYKQVWIAQLPSDHMSHSRAIDHVEARSWDTAPCTSTRQRTGSIRQEDGRRYQWA